MKKITPFVEPIAPNDSYVILEHANKVYPNGVHAVHDFNLDIKQKEFIVLVGPSGCGKSTTLRMITGLEEITNGNLFIDGVYSNELAPKDRNIALVFQSYALYPHMTVYDNMAFGLKMRKVPKDVIDEKVHEAAKMLEIEDMLTRKPAQLSGGQRQRVALGRAIVRDAKLFLMDEPLSNLDAKLRVQMRSEIVKLHKRIGATTIYVTHDQTEAMTMADRIVVMKDGYIQQIGSAQEIFAHPANTFVARFIGSPAMNLLKGVYDNGVIRFDDGKVYKLSKTDIEKYRRYLNTINEKELHAKLSNLEEEYRKYLNDKHLKKDEIMQKHVEYLAKEISHVKDGLEIYELIKANKPRPIILGIRPEGIKLASKTDEDKFTLNITFPELLGEEYYLHLDFGGHDLIMKTNAMKELFIGDKIDIVFNPKKIHLFDPITTKCIE